LSVSESPLCANSGHHSQFIRDYIVGSTCVSPSGKNSTVAIKIATPHRELRYWNARRQSPANLCALEPRNQPCGITMFDR
jgi:hypothetical protein